MQRDKDESPLQYKQLEILEVLRSIDPALATSNESFEKFLVETLEFRANQLRVERDSLKDRCDSILVEVNTRRCLIREEPHSGSVTAPYKLCLAKLEAELAATNERVAKREAQRIAIGEAINAVLAEMGEERETLPELVADKSLEYHESRLNQVEAERNDRWAQSNKFNSYIRKCRDYFGEEHSDMRAIDNESLATLQETATELHKRENIRENEIKDVTNGLVRLSKLLQVEFCLYSDVAPGSDARLAALQEQLRSMNERKLERLDEMIVGLIQEVNVMWDDLALDLNLRESFSEVAASEEKLHLLELEIEKLVAKAAEPDRKEVLDELQEYNLIAEKEHMLADIRKDRKWLSQPGFMEIARRETALSDYIDQKKPKVVAHLSDLVEKFTETHNGEGFWVNGKPLADVLSAANDSMRRRRNERRLVKQRLAGNRPGMGNVAARAPVPKNQGVPVRAQARVPQNSSVRPIPAVTRPVLALGGAARPASRPASRPGPVPRSSSAASRPGAASRGPFQVPAQTSVKGQVKGLTRLHSRGVEALPKVGVSKQPHPSRSVHSVPIIGAGPTMAASSLPRTSHITDNAEESIVPILFGPWNGANNNANGSSGEPDEAGDIDIKEPTPMAPSSINVEQISRSLLRQPLTEWVNQSVPQLQQSIPCESTPWTAIRAQPEKHVLPVSKIGNHESLLKPRDAENAGVTNAAAKNAAAEEARDGAAFFGNSYFE